MSERVAALSEAKFRCYVCNFDYAPVLHVHHIVPRAEGGGDSLANLVALCPTCHALVHRVRSLLKAAGSDVDFGSVPTEYHQYVAWAGDAIDAGLVWNVDKDARLWALARSGGQLDGKPSY